MILISNQTATPNPAGTETEVHVSAQVLAFAALIDAAGRMLADVGGKVLALPSDSDYVSAYTAQDIDSFIGEVLA